MVLNTAHGNTVKKIFILKIFPQLCKTFCVFVLIMYILFCLKNQKNMLQREIKDWAFEAYSPIHWLKKSVLDSHGLDQWKWLVRSCARFLNFYERERVWIFFLQHVLPKLSKITVTCPKSLKNPNMVNFDLPKVSKIIISLELLKVRKMTSWKMYISCHREAGNIKFQIWIPDKHHWKGSIGYSASDGSDVISS